MNAVKRNSVYIAMLLSGAAVLRAGASQAPWQDSATWLFFTAFTVITVPLLFARVDLVSSRRHYAMDDVAIYAIIFAGVGYWAVGAWIMFTASLCCEIYMLAGAVAQRGFNINWTRVFYNFTNPFARAVYLAVAGLTYDAVNQGAPLMGSARNFVAMGAAVGVYIAFTTILEMIETWTRGERLASLIDIYTTLSLNIVMLAPLGIVLAILWRNDVLAAVLLAVPVAIMHTSMKAVRGIVDDAQIAIETMMSALEERDAYTAGHSERVGRFAAYIAIFLGLPDEQVRQVRSAGRIHDIGKIDIPDAILRKTCCLDDHEYGIMKTHTDRPKQYAEKYPRLGRHIPFHVAACHHERFDGHGYVYGLRGEEIPLGARIISVADTWDAMTSDRPYRLGLGDKEALQRLRKASGTQFDPRVVDAFMRAYESGAISRVMHEWKETERFRHAAEQSSRSHAHPAA